MKTIPIEPNLHGTNCSADVDSSLNKTAESMTDNIKHLGAKLPPTPNGDSLNYMAC